MAAFRPFLPSIKIDVLVTLFALLSLVANGDLDVEGRPIRDQTAFDRGKSTR